MTLYSRLRRIIGLLVVLALLGACSALQMGYRHVDDIAYWWLDGYLDFSDEQSARVREDLLRLHRWHRGHELPQVVSLLQEMERLAPGDISPAQVCSLVDRLDARVDALAQHAEPAFAALASGLTAEQLTHLERKYQQTNADYRKDWMQLTAGELVEKRYRQFLDRAEMVYGRLDDAQKAVLRRQAAQWPLEPARTMAERQRRQADILQALRKASAPSTSLADARAQVRGMLERARKPADAAGRAYQQVFIDEGCRNTAVFHNSTTATQRSAAVRRLRAWQREFNELSLVN